MEDRGSKMARGGIWPPRWAWRLGRRGCELEEEKEEEKEEGMGLEMM
jgi:hypothetical protein